MRLPDQDEVARAVPAADLRALGILQGALGAGAVLFLAVTLALPVGLPPEADPAAMPPPVFSLAHLVLTLGAWGAAAALPAVRLRALAAELRAAPPADGAAAVDRLLPVVRANRILSLALLEGPALMGVGLVFLARTGGTLPARPELWVHTVPLAALLVVVVGTLPTAEGLGRAWRHVAHLAGEERAVQG